VTLTPAGAEQPPRAERGAAAQEDHTEPTEIRRSDLAEEEKDAADEESQGSAEAVPAPLEGDLPSEPAEIEAWLDQKCKENEGWANAVRSVAEQCREPAALVGDLPSVADP
jgi:hypothetical protein